ncbi:DNA-binding response regulator [Lachnoclostridium sp. An169]|uniref:response regulator transcription factor n=1 Tax=Lachnoclostridium sp. An169 TaxID=1965569 RepID=UPI000B3949B3|nr:response regulator transcription factor [Lachnoclostridium sp. An169]OUP81547.1 DNA-binding response regulator [Lachnoclostridium sp. An169]
MRNETENGGKPKLLVVEDDLLLAEAVNDYFTGKGWQVREAHDGETALEMAERDSWQMVLLDVMLPGKDGFEVCRQLRELSDVPVFFITARVMEEDELRGYASGADDYVTKPFSLPVLYAKVMAMMGRMRGELPMESMERLTRGGVEINFRTREVRIRGHVVQLPPKEYDLLHFFLENPNRVFTREQLLIRFWGYDFEGNERVVDNHIKKLRKALEGSGCRIRTERKAGYRLEVSL